MAITGSNDSAWLNSIGSWFTDSSPSGSSGGGGGGDDSIWGGVWDWASSDSGLATIGGAIAGGVGAYSDSQNRQSSEDNLRLKYSLESDLARLRDELAGPSEAELRDKRIKAHNKSINMPMNMSVRNR